MCSIIACLSLNLSLWIDMSMFMFMRGSLLLSSLIIDDMTDELSRVPFSQGLVSVLNTQRLLIDMVRNSLPRV